MNINPIIIFNKFFHLVKDRQTYLQLSDGMTMKQVDGPQTIQYVAGGIEGNPSHPELFLSGEII